MPKILSGPGCWNPQESAEQHLVLGGWGKLLRTVPGDPVADTYINFDCIKPNAAYSACSQLGSPGSK